MTDHCSPLSRTYARISFPLLFAGLIILFLDQVSKWLVNAYLPVINSFLYWYPYGGIAVFQNFLGIEFSINHWTNTGAAWGFFSEHQPILIFFRIGLIISLFIFLCFYNRNLTWRIPLVLIITGALGNVLDYFVYGHVIDMLHFVLWGYDFPVFNLADSAISVGIASLFFLSFFKANSAKP